MTCESQPSPARERSAGALSAIALTHAEQIVPPVRFTLGSDRLDAMLGGGLARGRLHELWPAAAEDGPAAAGFALMLAARAAEERATIIWIDQDHPRQGALYPPGLAELGIDPARILFVTTPDEKALLRSAGDVVRSPAAAVAVIAPAGPAATFDLTATRRLTLFAERSGTTAILLRDADPHAPSAAATRWRVASALSQALDANAPGPPAFAIDLVRQRAGAPAPGWRLEWDRDRARFAALSRAVAADDGGGYLATG
ncbi:ImuA family protein [Sphingomonas sp.]|uniref:ImuA family protein n=1 Tax=Sphingomonas sp. TaxID=28214 RepID=UPI003B3B577F